MKPRCLACRQKGKRAQTTHASFKEEKKKQPNLGALQREILVGVYTIYPLRWWPRFLSTGDKQKVARLVDFGYLEGSFAKGYAITQKGIGRVRYEVLMGRAKL
jgi:hypothetical protein